MPRVEDLLTPRELIDYTMVRQPKPHMGEVFFPERKTEALEIDIIKGANNLPVSAKVHSFDTEAEIGSRDGVERSMQDLALIKRKIKISEREIIALESPRNSREEAEKVRNIFNDVDNQVAAVRTRVECMRMEAITTGKIVVNENGVRATIDYGMPASHKKAFSWLSDPNADILGGMTEMKKIVKKDSGYDPARTLTSDTILSRILMDTKIREAIYGVNSAKLLTVAMLNEFLKEQKLPVIATYDEMYRLQDAKGQYVPTRFFSENGFVMMPDWALGNTFYGVTAEELELRRDPSVDMDEIGNIVVCQYATTDPVGKWIKAVATALPSFPYADQVFAATIN